MNEMLFPIGRDKVSVQEASELWGISRQAVYSHIQKGHLPKPSKEGTFPWPEVNITFVTHLRALAGRNNGNSSDMKNRLISAKAEREELQLQREKGTLGYVSEMEERTYEIARRVRDALFALPDRVVPVIQPNRKKQHKVHTVLIKEIRAVCESLSEEIKQ